MCGAAPHRGAEAGLPAILKRMPFAAAPPCTDPAPLTVHCDRHLWLPAPAGGAPQPFCAASGLVVLGHWAYVVADDELGLAAFNLAAPAAPARCWPLLDGTLPSEAAARKAAKPDFESLLHWPAGTGEQSAYPHGALLALGSGSRATRCQGALMASGPDGGVQGPAQTLDLRPWFMPWAGQVPELNVEGAFVQGDTLHLLQRRNGAGGVNACVTWPWPMRAQAQPLLTPWTLGELDGVPLGFTDGCAMPGGGWLFSAAAEDTDNAYLDGPCAGSVLGRVGADGQLLWLRRLVLPHAALPVKVEGVAVQAHADGLRVWMVTDADDRQQAAWLLRAELPADA